MYCALHLKGWVEKFLCVFGWKMYHGDSTFDDMLPISLNSNFKHVICALIRASKELLLKI